MIDSILYNALIVTQETGLASALAIIGERIVAVGSNDEILPLASANTKKYNLNGKTVIPGLTDAHLHWQMTSRALVDVNVYEVPTKQVALERVAARVPQITSGQWILGHGWTQDFWPDRAFPTAADLDTVAPNHPVSLSAKSGHAIWVNSATLRLCGISASTSDPEGGQIQRDASGQPTGIFFENAIGLVTSHIPHPSIQQIAESMKAAQKQALAAGLTGIHDFDGRDCFASLVLLREQGDLKLRVLKNINHEWFQPALELGLRWGFGDDWLRIGGQKIFADGALGPRTAHMIEAYNGEPDNFGISTIDKEEMTALVSKASQAGFPSTIHAIGDRAVHDVLDVYEIVRREEAARGEPTHARRHRIEHVQLVHPSDTHRLAELDIIASMQPIHATSDYQMADRYWGERSNLSYNPRIQLDQDVVVVFGSDAPIDPFDPIRGIHAAVTRRRADGSPGVEGWYPDARLTVEEAVRGFTIGPAYAAGMENRLGKIKVGYLADLVVLDRNIYSIPHDELLETKVLGTMVGGQWMYGDIRY